ncbi:MAG: choice-of-anchor D domain-containing protein [Armatimonadetes bacterium]|nr:choice-of-anchor D domain-containing protein [Armatimonadota bacterium]
MVGTTSAPQQVTVTNTGMSPLTIQGVSLTGANAGDFAIVDAPAPGAVVDPDGSCAVSITFTPSAVGPRAATLTITDDAEDSPQIVPLTGVGANAPPVLPPIGDKTAQYSDPVIPYALTASDANNTCSELTFSASGLPLNLTLANNGDCTATISGAVACPAGAYPVTYSVADTYGGSAQEIANVVVTKENATAQYVGDLIVSGSAATKTIDLSALITEEQDGSFGSVLAPVNAPAVTFHVARAGTPTTYYDIPASSVSPTGMPDVWLARASAALPDGAWEITTRFDSANPFFTGPDSSAVMVSVSSRSGSSATGGGWIQDPAGGKSHGGFGFTLRFEKRGEVKGESLYFYREGDVVYLVKAKAWDGLVFPDRKTACFQGSGC